MPCRRYGQQATVRDLTYLVLFCTVMWKGRAWREVGAAGHSKGPDLPSFVLHGDVERPCLVGGRGSRPQ